MLVSIIIPSKSNIFDTSGLKEDIANQIIPFAAEVIRIANISPPGKARNKGVEKAKGDIFIFLDDDIRLGHQMVFKNIIEPILSDQGIGVCGASQLTPLDANWFQRRCAKEIPHTEHPVMKETKEVGMVGGACFAIRKEVFFKIGKFNEELIRGIDVEFCHRLNQNNYKVLLTAQTWIHHPPPKDLWQLMKVSFRNGKATAFADRFYPELNFDIGTEDTIYSLERKSKKYRLWRYVKNIIKSIITFKFINLIGRMAYAIGYFFEIVYLSGKE